MSLFFPEWIPWWLQLVMVGIIVIFGLFFLLMPFSVFGLKSRLSYLDHQMEDIQAQLRVLLKRIPDARERLEFKLQPVSSLEQDVTPVKDKRKVESSEYYVAVPSTKSNSTRFDPPSQSTDWKQHNPSKTQDYEAPPPPLSESNRARDRDISTAREQLYDPPPQSYKEEKQDKTQPRRRAEPILRWPPR